MRLAVVALVWLVSRAWLVWLVQGPQSWVAGDVSYYFQSLQGVSALGLAETLREYPLPAVGVLAVPWVMAIWSGDVTRYLEMFLTVAVLTDLVFTLVLWRAARRHSLRPVTTWVLAVPLLGSTTYVRFDLLPGVLCGLAVLLLARRPGAASVLASVAAGIKLWPVLLLPALLGVRAARRRVLVGAALTGSLLVVVSLLLAGWERLFSPLGYQVARGLQVESVLATPAMVAWALVPDTWVVAYASSKSFEVDGPAVPALIAASTLATVLYLAALVASWARLVWLARLRVDVDPATSVWLVLGAVMGFIVIGKVFSPQYLLWVIPVAATAMVVVDSRPLRSWTALLLVVAGLTHVVFPLNYEVISAGTGAVVATVAALALRNGLVVWLFVVAAAHAWSGLGSLSGASSSRASREGRVAASDAPPAEGPPTPTGVASGLVRRLPRSRGGPRPGPRPPRQWRCR
ncbi:glycosyltransferase family 87 protein [soil metagenome]